MKKILFLTDFFFPNQSANTICAYEVANEMKAMGYEVHFLAFWRAGERKEESFEAMTIHRVRPRFYFRLRYFAEKNCAGSLQRFLIAVALLIHRFQKLLFFPLYPLTSPGVVWRYYRKARTICARNEIDKVVALYIPLEAAITGKLLKKWDANRTYLLYVVDSFSACTRASNHALIEWLNWNWEKRLYPYADRIFNMEFYESHHQQSRYDPYRDKMDFLGIPFVKPRDVCPDLKPRLVWKILYAGTLDDRGRDPSAFCYEVDKMNAGGKFRIELCGSSTWKIKEMKMTNHTVVHSDKVSREEIIKKLEDADILLSIGNRNSRMVPSKLFDYISFRKPIIHLYHSDADSCFPYLKQYRPVLLLHIEEKNIGDKLWKFMEQCLKPSSYMSQSEVLNRYKLSAPLFAARKFDEV